MKKFLSECGNFSPHVTVIVLLSHQLMLLTAMRVSKPKANTFNICCDGFAHNCQFAMMFNACITVVMNRLTHAMFHKVM